MSKHISRKQCCKLYLILYAALNNDNFYLCNFLKCFKCCKLQDDYSEMLVSTKERGEIDKNQFSKLILARYIDIKRNSTQLIMATDIHRNSNFSPDTLKN